jgi:hypothetical protein
VNPKPRRATTRDRHGRERFRASLVSERVASKTGMTQFEQIVSSTCDYLRGEWPTELKGLNWVVADAPALAEGETEVARYSVNPQTMTITIYRVPIIRLTHNRRTDFLDERMHIEQFVFSAVAELLGREPWH